MTDAREAELLASVPDKLFIAGKWVAASGGKTLDVQDPATGKVIRSIADATAEDVPDLVVDSMPELAALFEEADLLRLPVTTGADR